jgi:hypothetical protein
MGNGHSEAVAKTRFQTELFIPTPTLYEVNWWERKMHIDGAFRGGFNRIGRNAMTQHGEWSNEHKEVREMLRKEAFEAAHHYANAVSIGNMTVFRRFLATSLQKSDRPTSYIEPFTMMLNQDGRSALAQKLVAFTLRCGRISKANVNHATKLLLWFTRKRELLIPEWADDKRLWVPD